MKVLKLILVVTQDDPDYRLYREALTKEPDWIVHEDTIATSYEKTIIWQQEKEKKND